MTETKRHKRGDVREDGMVFWAYDKSIKSGEYWMSGAKFEEAKAAQQARDKNRVLSEDEREHRRAACREYDRKFGSARSKTPEYRKRKRDYNRERRANDPLFAMANRVRNRLLGALRRGGYPKTSKTFETIGCPMEDLKAHLENQFVEGMTWENRHLWEIDHIIPMASAKSKADIEALNHYTNLQPLWTADNRSKGSKILN